MNDRERLEFAIRFAQTDLPTEEQGWFKLHDELWEFLKPTRRYALMVSTKDILAKEETRSLQKYAYEMLADIVHAREDTFFEGKITETWLPSLGHRINVLLYSKPMGIGPCVDGSLRDVFLYRLFDLITQEPTDKIRRCSGSDCNQIFYRERKQKFCSERCQTRELMRLRRKDPEKAEKDAEKARIRYEERMKKKLGKKTKVAHRGKRRAR